MQETIVQVLRCKPRATWNEVGLYLCWKEECALCGAVGCAVWFYACWYLLMCWYVLIGDVVCCRRLTSYSAGNLCPLRFFN